MIACQHLVQHDRAAILIAAWIDNAACLFRRHVAHRPAHGNRLSYPRARLQGAGNTKIRDHQAIIFWMNQDVLRFYIAVDDRTRPRVRVVESVDKLVKVIHCLRSGQRTTCFCEPCAQRAGGVERHYQVDTGTILAIIKHGRDVGMVKRRGNTRFAQKMLVFGLRRFTGQQNLNRDATRKILIDPVKDRRVAAFTNQGMYIVATSQCSVQ